MYPQNKNRPKWQKIGIVAIALALFLALPCSAIYYAPSTDPKPYVPILDMQCEVHDTIFELTPSVYQNNYTTTTETAHYGISNNTIKRTNFEVHDPSDAQYYRGWRDVSYRLGLHLATNTDDFDMRLTSQIGVYNFTSYDLPMISVPQGYSITYDITYRVYYADGQEHDSIYYDQRIQGASASMTELALLQPYRIINGVQHDLIGNVLIVDYEAELNFIKNGSSLGSAGYYTFNGILGSLPESVLEAIGVDADYWWNTQENRYFQVVGTRGDGSSVTLDCNSIYFQEGGGDFMEMWYGREDMDGDLLVYNYDDDEWLFAEIGDLSDTESPDYISLDEIQVRQLYFQNDLENTFDTSYTTSIDMLNWFVANTTYSPTSFVLTDENTGAYDFTGRDGSIYVKYTCVDATSPYYVGYLKGYYDIAYKNGIDSGGGSGASFIGKTATWLLTTISDALSVEIFPGFSIGGVLGVLVAVLLAIVFLKVFAGG